MTIGILLIIIVISLLAFGLTLYYEIRGGYYGREIDKAFKDMERGITTTITEDQRGNFTVKKTKIEKKFMDESLKSIKDIYERFGLQNRNWKTESVTIYSDGKSRDLTNPLANRVEFKMKEGKLYVNEIFKNVSNYNGEEIVTYYEDTYKCIDDLFESGIIVGFEIADWSFTGRPAEIRIDYKDKHYNTFLVWNITERV